MINIIEFTKSYFNIDGNNYYVGYHNQEYRWNGWAVPCFTKEVADKIMQNMSNDDCKITYNEDENKYIVILNNDEEEKEICEMETINTNEGEKQVYCIGGCSWIWESYSLEQVKEDKDAIIIEPSDDNNKEYEY